MIIDGNYFDTIEIQKKNSRSNILFIHGFTSNYKKHEFIAKYLPDDISFYAINFPGSGETPLHLKIDHSRKGYAEIVAKYMEILDLHNVIIVAHSMGGSITAFLSQIVSNRIIGYFLEAPENESILQNNNILIDPKKDNLETGAKKIRFFLNNPNNPKDNEINLESNEETSSIIKILKRPLLVRIYWKLGIKPNIEEAVTQTNSFFKQIKKPTLILLGKNDHIILYEPAYKNFKENVKNRKIKIITIENSGHSIYKDNKRKYIYYLLWFLKKNKFSKSKINYKQFI